MRTAQVLRKQDNRVLVSSCLVTQSVFERMQGLLGRSGLAVGEGLWIEPCNSIHTFFMKFPIDVVYVDRDGKVLAVSENVKPWRAHFPVFMARSVLELPAGGAREIRVGDALCLS